MNVCSISILNSYNFILGEPVSATEGTIIFNTD